MSVLAVAALVSPSGAILARQTRLNPGRAFSAIRPAPRSTVALAPCGHALHFPHAACRGYVDVVVSVGECLHGQDGVALRPRFPPVDVEILLAEERQDVDVQARQQRVEILDVELHARIQLDGKRSLGALGTRRTGQSLPFDASRPTASEMANGKD